MKYRKGHTRIWNMKNNTMVYGNKNYEQYQSIIITGSTSYKDAFDREIYVADIVESSIICDVLITEQTNGFIKGNNRGKIFFVFCLGKKIHKLEVTEENSIFLTVIGNLFQTPEKLDKALLENSGGIL